jgi:hypothetical protein
MTRGGVDKFSGATKMVNAAARCPVVALQHGIIAANLHRHIVKTWLT